MKQLTFWKEAQKPEMTYFGFLLASVFVAIVALWFMGCSAKEKIGEHQERSCAYCLCDNSGNCDPCCESDPGGGGQNGPVEHNTLYTPEQFYCITNGCLANSAYHCAYVVACCTDAQVPYILQLGGSTFWAQCDPGQVGGFCPDAAACLCEHANDFMNWNNDVQAWDCVHFN